MLIIGTINVISCFLRLCGGGPMGWGEKAGTWIENVSELKQILSN